MALYEEEHVALVEHVASKPDFEHQCMTALVVCGPPPPTPFRRNNDGDWNLQNVARAALHIRNDWIDSVEKLMIERFKYPLGYVGDFVVAFEGWYDAERKEVEFQQELVELEMSLSIEDLTNTFLTHIKQELGI